MQERLPECGDLGLELVVGSKIKVPVREKRKSSKVILHFFPFYSFDWAQKFPK